MLHGHFECVTSYIFLLRRLDVTRASTGEEDGQPKEAFTRNDAVDAADEATKRFLFSSCFTTDLKFSICVSLSVLECVVGVRLERSCNNWSY